MKKEMIVIISLISFLLIFFISYLLFFNKPLICNDGTPYNECSKINPYFCSKGVLIEKASACGCGISKVEEDKCISPYQAEPKNITLNYVLRGKEGQISFVVYKKMADYLSELPRYVDSSENPTLLDFKLKMINQKEQRELLLPLVVEIEKLTKDKTDQARIAINLIQNIPFGNSTKTLKIGNIAVEYQRYPYEVLYDVKGICSEKSELMIFLLREIGYGTSSLYYNLENHEAVGIKCPKEKTNVGEYCFVETTGASIITDDRTEYFGAVRKLLSSPKVTNISEGISLENNLYEYRDAKLLINIRNDMRTYGTINPLQYLQFKNLKQKYGLINPNEYIF